MFTGKTNTLTDKIRKGDADAFEEFYRIQRKPVYDLALKYLKDPQLAEDAVQDVFLTIWTTRENLDTRRSLKGLLFTSLKNHVLNMLKMNKRRVIRQFEYLNIHPRKNQAADSDAFVEELRQILNEGMQLLPEGKQTVYRMKRLEGYSNKEIANRLDVSVNTVKSQFRRANLFITEYVNSKL